MSPMVCTADPRSTHLWRLRRQDSCRLRCLQRVLFPDIQQWLPCATAGCWAVCQAIHQSASVSSQGSMHGLLKSAGAYAEPSKLLQQLSAGACTPQLAAHHVRCSAGQGIDHLDSLFVGNFLGRQSDIGSGELRDWAFRKFNHLVRHLQADGTLSLMEGCRGWSSARQTVAPTALAVSCTFLATACPLPPDQHTSRLLRNSETLGLPAGRRLLCSPILSGCSRGELTFSFSSSLKKLGVATHMVRMASILVRSIFRLLL